MSQHTLPRKTTNLEEVLELLAVVQGGNVGGELEQVFGTLASLLNNSLVKSPYKSMRVNT